MRSRSLAARSALWLGIVLLGAALFAAVPFAPSAQAATSAQVIERINTTQPVMALTFDAGADRGYAAQILDTLEQKGVKASFGMTGMWAEQNPDLLQRMVRDGDQLMNHSYDHPDFTTISSAQRADQLQRTQAIIQQITGVDVRPYFRPPFGAYNSSVLADLAANGYLYSVMWTVDTLGWNGASVAEITSRTLNAAGPGSIVLMHVGADSLDAQALPGIIDQLRSRGYRFDTIANLVGTPTSDYRYFPETGHTVGHAFLSFWNAYGGLPTFGYPLTEEFRQVSPTDGNTYTVQYFERARFEYHPEFAGTKYEVELGLLGNQIAQAKGLLSTAPFQKVSAQSDANCTFYAATGHRLCFGFRDFWQSHGGLMIYGYPISEEYRDPATGFVTQYFERQRLEWHPENTPAWQVEGGLLGAQVLAMTP